jgi:hypothetical protein
MDNRESKSGGNRGIDGIAPGLHHFDSSPRGEFVNTDYDGMWSMGRTQRSSHGRDDQACRTR